MREIKFRAWDEENKTMLEVVAISWATNDVICFDPNNNPEDDIVLDLSKAILMQYTGLHDKHGKEIYEGGRYDWRGKETGVIVFDKGCFVCKPDDSKKETCELWAMRDLEVTGNVFSNPDLLEK